MPMLTVTEMKKGTFAKQSFVFPTALIQCNVIGRVSQDSLQYFRRTTYLGP